MISTNGLRFDTALTGAAVMFYDANAFWQQFLPVIPAASKLTEYPVFDPNMEAFKELDIEKTPFKKVGNSTPPRVSFKREMRAVKIEPYHAMTEWMDEVDINEEAQVGIDTVQEETLETLQLLNTQMDIALINMMTAGANWTDYPLTTKWNEAGADPEDNVLEICDDIETETGGKVRPNTMLLSRSGFRAMISKKNTLRSDLKYVLAKREDLLVVIKNLFTLEDIIIVPSAKNTAKKNKAPSMAAILGNKGWVGYLEKRMPSKRKASAAYGVGLKIGRTNEYGIRVTKLDTRGSMAPEGQTGVETKVEIFTNFFVCCKKLGRTISNIF